MVLERNCWRYHSLTNARSPDGVMYLGSCAAVHLTIGDIGRIKVAFVPRSSSSRKRADE